MRFKCDLLGLNLYENEKCLKWPHLSIGSIASSEIMVEYLKFELSYWNVLLFKICVSGNVMSWQCANMMVVLEGVRDFPSSSLVQENTFRKLRERHGPYIRLRGLSVFVFSGGNSMHQSLWEVKWRESSVEIRADSIMELSVLQQCWYSQIWLEFCKRVSVSSVLPRNIWFLLVNPHLFNTSLRDADS